MTDTNIRILLIDDHTLFRTGLRYLFEQEKDFHIVGEATDGLIGLSLAKQVNPHIVLLDLDMPGIHGLDVLTLLLTYNPNLIILILTVSEDTADLNEALKRGAKGYLLKNIDADYLVTQIRSVLTGAILSPPKRTLIPKQTIRPHSNQDVLSLTQRENDVLHYICKGVSNKGIAATLNLSENTVKAHVQNILRKLNVNSRIQAAIYATEMGLDKIHSGKTK